MTDVNEVHHNGIKFVPRLGDELDVDAVILPENAEEYGTTQDLLCDIQQFIAKYVDVPEQYRTYCSYYILLSWVYDRFNTINYLRVRGDLGQGKTRFLQTVGQICYKPMIAAGALGAAPVFRILSRWGGTLVMDESDFTTSDETDALVKVLNVGYQKGMSVMRCDKNDPNKLDFFKVFGPKVISSRKVFDDQALESRCLSHEMYRTKRKDIPDTLTSEFLKEQMTLRNKLLLYRFRNYMRIDSDKINDINLGDEIEPRLRQATRSFVALLVENQDMVEDFKKFLKAYNRKLVAERSTTIDGMVVRGIALLVQHGHKDISSKDIMEVLSETGDLWEKANSRSVGKRLSALGIQTHDKRVVTKDLKNAVRNCIQWDSFDLSIFDRYLSDRELATVAKEITQKVLQETKVPQEMKVGADGKIGDVFGKIEGPDQALDSEFKDQSNSADFVACSVCSVIYEDRHQTRQCGKEYTDKGCSEKQACPTISRYKHYILQAKNNQDLPPKLVLQKVLQEIMVGADGKMMDVQEIVDGLQQASDSEFKEQDIQEQLELFKRIGYIYEPKKGRIGLVNQEDKVMFHD
jgi:hypothetical protein